MYLFLLCTRIARGSHHKQLSEGSYTAASHGIQEVTTWLWLVHMVLWIQLQYSSSVVRARRRIERAPSFLNSKRSAICELWPAQGTALLYRNLAIAFASTLRAILAFYLCPTFTFKSLLTSLMAAIFNSAVCFRDELHRATARQF